MKTIKMLRDVEGGRLKAGQVINTSDEAAESYVEQGIAEFVDEKNVKTATPPAMSQSRSRRSQRRARRTLSIPKPREKRVVLSAGGWAYELTDPDKEFMYEVVEHEGRQVFCIFNGRKFRKLDSIEQADAIIFPPPEDKVTWPLPNLIQGTGNPPDAHPLFLKGVWDEVHRFIYAHLDIGEEEYYDLLTAYVFATWFQDKPLSASPHPFFIGLKKTGKTRALEVLQQLCFRAKMLISVSAAAMYTNVELLHPTMLIDEADLQNEEKRQELNKMLLVYRPDQYVERKDPKAKGFNKLVIEKSFCYKAIASRNELNENIMDRCIPIKMQTRVRPIKQLRSESKEKATGIRTKLLELRMRMFDTVEEKPTNLRDDRVNELFTPLVSMASTFGSDEAVQNLMKIAKETMLSFERAKKRTVEYDLIEALRKLRDEMETTSVKGRVILPTSKIKEKMNEGRPEDMQVSFKQIAKSLVRLGFERDTMKYQGKTLACAIIPLKRFEHYVRDFGFREGWSELKSWVAEHREFVKETDLAVKAKELGLDPQKVVKELKKLGLICDSPEVGKWGVVHRG